MDTAGLSDFATRYTAAWCSQNATSVAADEATSGPARLTVVDPDANQIRIDQHVPKPGK